MKTQENIPQPARAKVEKIQVNSSQVSTFVSDWVQENDSRVVGWRRHLHRNPELSHMEYLTTDFIMETLSAAGLQPERLPTNGVVADIGPVNEPMIAFRGDIDALPIQEVTGLDFASEVPGVMHACGHDMHTTVVLGLAVALAAFVDAHGPDALGVRVRFIFQPAEEVMDGGATEVIAAGALNGVSQIFALHCEPKLRSGEVGLRVGAITSASDVVEIVLRGTGGHTSRPHLTSDLVFAAGLVATQLPLQFTRRVDPRSGTVVTFGAINGGATFNAIPEEVRLLGTFRTADVSVWRQGEELITELVEDIVRPTGAKVEIRYTKGVPPVSNDDVSTSLLAQAVKEVDPHALKEAPQSSGGEDFSWYLEHVPGSMARLGTWNGKGERPDLHQPDIVFDERALRVGIRMFAGVVEQFRQDREWPEGVGL
ncbi:Metal-dependentamidase/aminoacylase/carboxypeptidase [Corynebacterium resistens DSM 45100]|uniref:Metal-dependentamidase/aminoacylase/carboxypeptidase n=1 Tax=Corynebacterium resistens (strain DSM 45100 / JCM 12819 / GTC 2026 / SICGH 158) TaxID=662755 RepID=F8E1G5_CORRG|nr:amidohydrolase [Corynebacterium resistens]AEI10117.1 Metal-dependentamidase/aminoacylase/carboxypeptidase [Corynebacterium resistens DSM 45100]